MSFVNIDSPNVHFHLSQYGTQQTPYICSFLAELGGLHLNQDKKNIKKPNLGSFLQIAKPSNSITGVF